MAGLKRVDTTIKTTRALDRLAGLFEYWALLASTDPPAFLEQVSAEIERLRVEIKETRAEDAAVRRAYLHEHWRAIEACRELQKHDPAKAEELTNKAYRGEAG